MGTTSVLSLLLRFILTRENARRDALGAPVAKGVEKDVGEEDSVERFLEDDRTDFENLKFRYSL